MITFVTGNENKRREVEAILCPVSSGSNSRLSIVSQKLDLPELQGKRQEIAKAKCEAASKIIQGPVLTEDTSLCFDALNQLPGPFIKV